MSSKDSVVNVRGETPAAIGVKVMVAMTPSPLKAERLKML
jgi:hypothetical protein